MSMYDGTIKLSFISRNGRTVAKDTYRSGNSRISSSIPTNDGTPYYFLIATGGGYTEGESYLQEIELEKDTHAVLTTQTPNYVYKSENMKLTRQKAKVDVAKNACLEFYIDETIPYKNAYYRQNTEISMGHGAKLILTDGLTSGWSPDEHPFQYRQIGLKTTIRMGSELLLNDFLLVDPTSEPMYEFGYFEGKTNFNSVVIIDEDADEKMVDELRKYLNAYRTNSAWGITLLEKSGLVLRVMGESAHANHKLMWHFIEYYRKEILGFEALDLRKSEHLELGW